MAGREVTHDKKSDEMGAAGKGEIGAGDDQEAPAQIGQSSCSYQDADASQQLGTYSLRGGYPIPTILKHHQLYAAGLVADLDNLVLSVGRDEAGSFKSSLAVVPEPVGDAVV
jgi:hypothetical protein